MRVDSGLAWSSALRVWEESLRDPTLKSTHFGGTTGFWRQARSSRIVLAIEMPASSVRRTPRFLAAYASPCTLCLVVPRRAFVPR